MLRLVISNGRPWIKVFIHRVSDFEGPELFIHKMKSISYCQRKEYAIRYSLQKMTSLLNARNQTPTDNLSQHLDHINEYIYLLQNNIEIIKLNATF